MNTQYLLVAILMVLVFAVGFMVGRVTAPAEGTVSAKMFNGNDKNQETSGATNDNGGVSGTSADSGGSATINSSDLTEGQRKLLTAMGINADEFVVTAEMAACAEAKLGAGRMEQIKNGDTPSFSEGASLVACYK